MHHGAYQFFRFHRAFCFQFMALYATSSSSSSSLSMSWNSRAPDVRSISSMRTYDVLRSTAVSADRQQWFAWRLTLVPEVAEDVDGDADVRGDKVLVVEGHECVEALEEGDQAGEDEGEVGQVGLERLRVSGARRSEGPGRLTALNGRVSRGIPCAFIPRMNATWLARMEICRQHQHLSRLCAVQLTQVSDPKIVTEETK